MAANVFNPSSNHPARAVQAWQILVSAAMNRQTLTYKGLARMMYRRDAQGVLDKILGHIAFYCIDHNIPPLTSIVVGQRRGTPGRDIPMDLTNLDKEREKVYAYDGTMFILRPPMNCTRPSATICISLWIGAILGLGKSRHSGLNPACHQTALSEKILG